LGAFGSERDRRVEALRLVVEEGLGVGEAAERVNRSRQWLSKWLQRSRGGEGLGDRSRVSSASFEPLDERWVELVLKYRRDLEKDPVASVGGLSILAAMERDELSGLPSVRSIERILTGHGVSRTTAKKPSRSTTPKLPLPEVSAVPGIWQQADWVQERYLTGGVRFNSLQITDMGSAGACQVVCVRLLVHRVSSLPGKAMANALSACFQPCVPVPRSPPRVGLMLRMAR